MCVESPERIPEGASVRAWLLGIARNLLLRHFRDQSRESRAMQRESAVDRDARASASVRLAAREEQRLLLRALRTLPLDLQIAIELYYWEQLTNDEIALVLGIPTGTVKSRLFRARSELRAAIAAIAPSPHVASTTLDALDAWARSLAAVAREPDDDDGV